MNHPSMTPLVGQTESTSFSINNEIWAENNRGQSKFDHHYRGPSD